MLRQKSRTHTILVASSVAVLLPAVVVPCYSFGNSLLAGKDSRNVRTVDTPAGARVKQARILMSQKRYEEAIRLLNEAASCDPSLTKIHFLLGSAYYNSDQTDKAIEEYEAGLKANPGIAEAMFNLGSCYERKGQNDKAATCYENYLHANPASADAADVRRIIEELKKTADVDRLFNESHDLLQQGKAVEARFLLEKAAAIEPDSAEIHYNLGMAYHNSGNLPRAIAEFEQTLKIKPAMSEAMLNIGSSYQALGRKSEAVIWLQKYLAARPAAENAKAVSSIIASLQSEAVKQVGDDPGAADFWGSVTRQGIVRRWDNDKLPIKIFIDTGAGTPGMRDSFRQILRDSFDAWMQAAQGKLGYRLVASKDLADLVCDWTSAPQAVTGGGSEQGVAHIYGKNIDGGTLAINRATIRILTVDPAKGATHSISDDAMRKTCLHEIGHVLGLMGHSSNSHDVMFFSESPAVWPVLSKRDKATVLKLYQGYPKAFAASALASPPP